MWTHQQLCVESKAETGWQSETEPYTVMKACRWTMQPLLVQTTDGISVSASIANVKHLEQ